MFVIFQHNQINGFQEAIHFTDNLQDAKNECMKLIKKSLLSTIDSNKDYSLSPFLLGDTIEDAYENDVDHLMNLEYVVRYVSYEFLCEQSKKINHNDWNNFKKNYLLNKIKQVKNDPEKFNKIIDEYLVHARFQTNDHGKLKSSYKSVNYLMYIENFIPFPMFEKSEKHEITCCWIIKRIQLHKNISSKSI